MNCILLLTLLLSHFDRLDNLIMEAINNLEESGGSNKTTIGTYIEVVLFLL